MFKQYITAELIIFTKLKKYFEKLPAVGSDEYYNAFYDIVAQYINGGNEYLVAGDLFNFAIVAQAEIAYEQLSNYYQRHINEYYESFMNYKVYDDDTDEIVYDLEEIYHLLMGRFKSWIDDTFDEEYLEDGYIDEEKYIEEDYEEDDGDEWERIEIEEKEKDNEIKSSKNTIDPNTDLKALKRWQNYYVSYRNYENYINNKSDQFYENRFCISFIDILYISNFNRGVTTIHLFKSELDMKLSKYSTDILCQINYYFRNDTLSRLSKRRRNQLIKILEKACDFTKKNNKYGDTVIEGVGPNYLSTLLHAHFPSLIPILDRRVLINLGLVTRADLYANGQIKNIERFYGPLVEKIAELSKKENKSVAQLDYEHYIKKLDIDSLEN